MIDECSFCATSVCCKTQSYLLAYLFTVCRDRSGRRTQVATSLAAPSTSTTPAAPSTRRGRSGNEKSPASSSDPLTASLPDSFTAAQSGLSTHWYYSIVYRCLCIFVLINFPEHMIAKSNLTDLLTCLQSTVVGPVAVRGHRRWLMHPPAN